jgi:hypothetical protein
MTVPQSLVSTLPKSSQAATKWTDLGAAVKIDWAEISVCLAGWDHLLALPA